MFDVQALRDDFSFRTQGRPCYGVNLANKTIPHSGATFAIAFEQPGGWSTVLAWRDLASSEVKFKQPSRTALLFAMGDLVLFGPLFIIVGLVLAGEWMAACIFAGLLAFAVSTMLIRGVRRNREV